MHHNAFQIIFKGPNKKKKAYLQLLKLRQERSLLDFNGITCKDIIAHIYKSDQGLEAYFSWSEDCMAAFCKQ